MAKKVTYQAEKLISSTDKKRQGIYGIDLSGSDIVSFANLPVMDVIELPEKVYIDSKGDEITTVRFDFTNLQESVGSLARIVVYYEVVYANTIRLSQTPTIQWLQTKKTLIEIPLFGINNAISFETTIEIENKPITYYNFYAIYVNADNTPALINDLPIISYVEKLPCHGMHLPHDIFEVKSLISTDSIDVVDVDNKGYGTVVELTSNKFNVEWFDLWTIQSQKQWDALFEGEYFCDTYNEKHKLKFAHIQRFEYYLPYMFISENSLTPAGLKPGNLDLSISDVPQKADLNGRWIPLGKQYDNKLTLNVEVGQVIGLWVGFKLNLNI